MSKATFFLSTPFDKLKEKDLIKFRKYIDKLTNNVQEVIYYITTQDQNLQLEKEIFENVCQESQKTIMKIVNSKTISDCRDIIDEFKVHFFKFSDYFKKVQNELFEKIKKSISSGFLNEDELDIDNQEKKWKEIFTSLKKKHRNDDDQDFNKVDVCYAISMVSEVIDDLISFYEDFPEKTSIQEMINYYENKDKENSTALAECQKKLSEKDEQINTLNKECQDLQNELMRCKKQNEDLSRKNTVLQNELRNSDEKISELDNIQADLIQQISDLQSQLTKAQENPTPKYDQNELKLIKQRYIAVLNHIRDLTLVID